MGRREAILQIERREGETMIEFNRRNEKKLFLLLRLTELFERRGAAAAAALIIKRKIHLSLPILSQCSCS